jgi:hypothetical protein
MINHWILGAHHFQPQTDVSTEKLWNICFGRQVLKFKKLGRQVVEVEMEFFRGTSRPTA